MLLPDAKSSSRTEWLWHANIRHASELEALRNYLDGVSTEKLANNNVFLSSQTVDMSSLST